MHCNVFVSLVLYFNFCTALHFSFSPVPLQTMSVPAQLSPAGMQCRCCRWGRLALPALCSHPSAGLAMSGRRAEEHRAVNSGVYLQRWLPQKTGPSNTEIFQHEENFFYSREVTAPTRLGSI